jgi:hypothetical protein
MLQAKDVQTNIPNGAILSIYTLIVSSILILFVSCSLEPTVDVSSAMSILDTGNTLIYDLNDPSAAKALAIPAVYATAFGFILPSGKLICSLAMSKLLPIELAHITQRNSQPYASIVIVSFLGYGICLLAYYSPYISSQLFNICCLSAFTCYITQCVGFILLRTKHVNLKRTYRSPLGIPGAVFASLVYSLGLVSIVCFEDKFILIVYLYLLAAYSIYYYFVGTGQAFSVEEQKVILTSFLPTPKGPALKTSNSSTFRTLSGATFTVSFIMGFALLLSTEVINQTKQQDDIVSKKLRPQTPNKIFNVEEIEINPSGIKSIKQAGILDPATSAIWEKITHNEDAAVSKRVVGNSKSMQTSSKKQQKQSSTSISAEENTKNKALDELLSKPT